MNFKRQKPQPKQEWESGNTYIDGGYTEHGTEDEWEARQLMRQEMIGWSLPYSDFPTLAHYAHKPGELDGGYGGMIESVAYSVGKCVVFNGVMWSEPFNRELREPFVAEEVV